MNRLYAEIHRWKSTPHIWGQSDCILVLADWVREVTGIDPAEAVRGTYDSRGSCQRETGFLRDPVGAVAKYVEGVSKLPRGNELRRGDVAIIVRRDDPRREPTGGLWLGECWCCKGPDAATTLHPKIVEIIAFWNVGYED